MTSKKIPCYCIFFTIIFSVIFLACDNTMIEKQNSDFSVKIPISQFYNDNSSVSSSDSVYVIEAWVGNKNTTLQTISQNVIPGETSVTIDFKNIPVGQKVKVYIKLTQDQNTIYEGSSDWVIIKMGKNNIKINIKGDFSQPEQPTTYTVTFNSQGGSAVKAQTVDAAGIATKPEDPTKDNCVFEYWCTDSNCQNKFNFETAITGDITLYAKWRDANQVASVGFDPATGSVDKNTLVTLSCETENATIYYNFENKEFSENTWQNDGWKPYPDDTREGITIFDGTEYTTRTLYAIAVCDGMENSDITSKTYSLTEYTIIFNTNCGTPIDNLKVESGNEIILKEYSQFNRDGYNFEGWYFDEEYTKSVAESGILYPSKNLANTENEINLYAKWTPITYTITYYLNAEGDTTEPENPNNITEYTIKSETIVLQEPTRDGYAFVGWYTDSNYGNQITQIKQGSTGDITLYAQWVQAQQVSSWADLATRIDNNNISGSESTPLVIQLKNSADGSNGWIVDKCIEISKPVTLIATEEIEIAYDNTTGELDGFFYIISGALVIEGNSSENNLILAGSSLAKQPLIYSSGNLSLKNCILQNNISSSSAGAIYFGKQEGELSLENVTIENCSMSSSNPSAIWVASANSVNLKEVTISDTPDNSYCMYVAAVLVNEINLDGKIDMDNSIYLKYNVIPEEYSINIKDDFNSGENGLRFDVGTGNYVDPSNFVNWFKSEYPDYTITADGTVTIKNQQSE